MSAPVRVLLIEDSENDALLILNELRNGGFDPSWERVDTAGALRAAFETKTWDLIISDIEMPQLDIMEVVAIRNESCADVPFIIVSGTFGEDGATAALKRGVSDCLHKGDLKRLAASVERQLRDAAERRKRRL